jgi:hypothetical protein
MTNVPSAAVPPIALSPSAGATTAASPSALPATPRPIVQAWAPERYRVQFTIGPETHEKLRRLQELLRREIRDGDPGTIFDRALTVLLDKVEKRKLGATDKPRPDRPVHPGTDSDRSIRPRTDPNRPIRLGTDSNRSIRSGTDTEARKPTVHSRHIPREVQRVVWRRDGGQCAFVSPTGRRCTERTFVEFHHIEPHAMQGPPTVANISLRCWRHNQHEAELIFGPHSPSFGPARFGPTRTIDS